MFVAVVGGVMLLGCRGASKSARRSFDPKVELRSLGQAQVGGSTTGSKEGRPAPGEVGLAGWLRTGL